MKRIVSLLVLVILDLAVIGCFLGLCGANVSEAAQMVLWQGKIWGDYSIQTIIVGICGLVYLKIIWKLIHRC